MKPPFSKGSQYEDNDLDDAEFDDGQDLWEDLSGDADSSEESGSEVLIDSKKASAALSGSSKKRSYLVFLISFVLTLFLLGGVVWFYHSDVVSDMEHSIPQRNALQDLRVVPSESSSADAPESDQSSVAQISENLNFPDKVNSLTSENAETLNGTDGKEDILTPLPDIEQLKQSQLSDLDVPSDKNSASQFGATAESDISWAENQKNLSRENEASLKEEYLEEKKLLSATDTPPLEVFKETPPHFAEEKSDVLSAVLDKDQQSSLPKETVREQGSSQKSEGSDGQVKSEKRAADEEKSKTEEQGIVETVKKVKDIPASAKKYKGVNKDGLERSAKPKTPKTASWVLRSAHHGGAMIADSRTGQIISVEKGNFVAGLGRILSISKVNGRWVVEGTLSSLSQ